MYIEDIISILDTKGNFFLLNSPIVLSSNDGQVIMSLSNQISRGLGFTEKQRWLALRLIKKYSSQLNATLNQDIAPFITTPQFKFQLRVIESQKNVKIRREDSSNRWYISVYFPYDEKSVQSIREYRKQRGEDSNFSTVIWNTDLKCWEFELREDHIDWLNSNFLDSSYVIDDNFKNYVEQIQGIKNNLEKYVPMVDVENEKFIFKNCNSKITKELGNNVIEALVTAKKYGVTTWSETVDSQYREKNNNPLLNKFLETQSTELFSLDKERFTIFDVMNFIKFTSPCLIVIPGGGSELRHLELCVKMLQNEGILNQNQSVLFRLDNEKGKNFNNFVKEQKLNNPVNENTQVVFISGKIPKPLIESKTYFNSIISFGVNGVHYLLSNYLRNHSFVINYSLKEADFVNL